MMVAGLQRPGGGIEKGGVVTVIDPVLLLLGIALFLLQLMRLTAQFGIAWVAQQRLRNQGTPEVSST